MRRIMEVIKLFSTFYFGLCVIFLAAAFYCGLQLHKYTGKEGWQYGLGFFLCAILSMVFLQKDSKRF